MSNKTVIMPKELTAENGAKGLLSGEFKETLTVHCVDCAGLGYDLHCHECKACDGVGELNQDVPITWTTIKEIYAMAVKHFGEPTGDQS